MHGTISQYTNIIITLTLNHRQATILCYRNLHIILFRPIILFSNSFLNAHFFFESHDSPQHSTFARWKLIQPGPVNMMTLAGQTARVSTQQRKCNCSLEGSFLTSTFRFLHRADYGEQRWSSCSNSLTLNASICFVNVQSSKNTGSCLWPIIPVYVFCFQLSVIPKVILE